MLVTLLGSFLKDVLQLMKRLPAGASAEEKRKALASLGDSYPSELIEYMASARDEDFMADVAGALEFLKFGHVPEARGILTAIADYIAGDFGRRFDTFDREFFFAEIGEREAKLKEVFPGGSVLEGAVRDYVLMGTYQQVAEDAQELLKQVKEAPTVVIQSALEVPSDMRIKVRELLSERYPDSFIEFQINPQIIGGLRVFIDGKVTDHSWLSQIERISELTYQFS